MKRLQILASALLVGAVLALTGCLYDNPPSGPSQNIDTWLVGQWDARDKSGSDYHVVVAPSSPSHYRITLTRGGRTTGDYDAWISKVDGFTILITKILSGEFAGKHALFHYELLAPGTPPPGGVGAARIRLSELQLDPSAETLDSYHLRRDIRDALKAGTLLAPYDVVSDRKADAKAASNAPKGTDLAKPETSGAHANASDADSSTEAVSVPGSVIWTKSGGVTLNGETF